MEDENTPEPAMPVNKSIKGANLHKSMTPANELTAQFADIAFALVQEPPLHNGRVVGFPGLNQISFGDSPRAAIITPCPIKVTPLEHLSSGDLACVSLTSATKEKDKYILASVYLDRLYNIDESLEKEIPDGVEVIKRPIWEPYSFYKRFTGKKKEKRVVYASARDLRRAFGFRWAMIVPSMILKDLMRHASVQTTEAFYVGLNAKRTIDAVRVHTAAFERGKEEEAKRAV